MHPEVETLRQLDQANVNGRAPSEIVEWLASLPPEFYESIRKKMADHLDWRVSVLDKEVQKRVPSTRTGKPLQGKGLTFPDILPAEYPVDGDMLLTALMNVVERYIAFPSSACLIVVLWIVRAFAHPFFQYNPLLVINSPEMRCGKTTLLNIISLLVPRPLMSSNCSPSVIFRVIERHLPTLLIDEFDSFGEMHEELRNILNSGHMQGGGVLRCEGETHEPRLFKTCTPTVVAMIGSPPPTVRDRSFEIPMQRKTKKDTVKRFPRKGQELEALRAECGLLQRQTLRFVEDHGEELQNADPLPVESLSDRAQDNWDSLLSIADVIGGEWPRMAREAAAYISSRMLKKSLI